MESPDDAAILIISMAHSLNLHIIAEGIQMPAELAFIKAQGCDEAQGYLISRPLSASKLTTLLEARRSCENHWELWNV